MANNSLNNGSSESGETASVIKNMPVNKTPKPMQISPAMRIFVFLQAIMITIPTSAVTDAIDIGFKKLSIALAPALLPISPTLKMTEVTVVPILAPIMIPIALRNFNTPALTKPTTITVVAEELCIAAVTTKPNSSPLKTLLVIFSRVFSNRPPDSFSNPDPSVVIPYKNSASPPAKLIMLKTFSIYSHLSPSCSFIFKKR